MNKSVENPFALAALLGLLNCGVAASTEAQAIDPQHSSLKIYVSKSGLFSAFAHNHEIEAPISSGAVQPSENASVELSVDARKLQVLDPEVSESSRAQIQKTMEGSQVLDADRFPEIHFRSTEVASKGTGHWLLHGTLDLHGQSRPVAVDVVLKDGLYRGSATFKQTTFGITPVTVAGGTVKVKDELKIEFAIALAK